MRRFVSILALSAIATLATAQDAYVKATVDATEVTVESRFWIHIEAQGEQIEWPSLPEIDGLWVNPRPMTSEHMVISTRTKRHVAKLSYSAIALQPGPVTIPSIRVLINGQPMYTDPIEISVVGEPAQSPQSLAQVRAWVEEEPVIQGQPFWLSIEASGGAVRMPDSIQAEGLRIDTINIRRGRSISLGRGVYSETLKNSYHCTAQRAGQIEIPGFSVEVDGRIVETSPFTITVLEEFPSDPIAVGDEQSDEELTRDDLVFINMEVDKTEVYQGEPLLLKNQLWRISHRYIQSGPVRGSLIVPPSTEGFYVTYLEPVSYIDRHKSWDYDVSEERKVLYPTAIGDLRIGQWHWEGVALVYSNHALRRNRFSYSLNAGPIKIKVKPLPPRPAGFSGAVGQFDMTATFNTQALKQGVPARLVVTVTGAGNPDAIGDPVFAEMPWAQLSEADRKTDLQVSAQKPYPVVTKQFAYELVPLRAGAVTVPPIEFIYFDPLTEQYETKTAGPFSAVVESMPGVPDEVLSAAENQQRVRSVEIVSDDIMPIARKVSGLQPERTLPWVPYVAGFAPILAFAAAALVAARRDRFARDKFYARSVHAYRRAVSSLDKTTNEHEPAAKLFQIVVQYVADVYGREPAGLTSADVRDILNAHAIDPKTVESTVAVLRSCERANYAAQKLSPEDWDAMMHAAREVINGIEGQRTP